MRIPNHEQRYSRRLPLSETASSFRCQVNRCRRNGDISISIHANPGPEATTFRAEHSPPHVHLGSNDGPRVDTENFRPLSDTHARKMTRAQRKMCESLSDSQKALIRGRQALVFKHGKYVVKAMSMPLIGADSFTNACRSDPIACVEIIEAAGPPSGLD